MKKLMHFLARLFPAAPNGDNAFAVSMYHRMIKVKDFINRKRHPRATRWPVCAGTYRVIDPAGQIAVCTLTSPDFFDPATMPAHVAIMGTVMTPNLGIESMIRNVISNSHIRYLLLCGRDSPVFRAGEALCCLFQYGIDEESRIVQATGHFPVLRNLNRQQISRFLAQVQLVNALEEKDPARVKLKMEAVYVPPMAGPAEKVSEKRMVMNDTETFTELRPGGRRIPLEYDTKGFFVITTDRARKEITVKHYDADNHPGFILHGHSGESILLAIIDKGLLSQWSHAGYLGAELAKAETAIRLGLQYQQDRPLKMP